MWQVNLFTEQTANTFKTFSMMALTIAVGKGRLRFRDHDLSDCVMTIGFAAGWWVLSLLSIVFTGAVWVKCQFSSVQRDGAGYCDVVFVTDQNVSVVRTVLGWSWWLCTLAMTMFLTYVLMVSGKCLNLKEADPFLVISGHT